jgi:hypothetical protein
MGSMRAVRRSRVGSRVPGTWRRASAARSRRLRVKQGVLAGGRWVRAAPQEGSPAAPEGADSDTAGIAMAVMAAKLESLMGGSAGWLSARARAHAPGNSGPVPAGGRNHPHPPQGSRHTTNARVSSPLRMPT